MKRNYKLIASSHLLRNTNSEHKKEMTILPLPVIGLINFIEYENEQVEIDIEIAWLFFGLTITIWGNPKCEQ